MLSLSLHHSHSNGRRVNIFGGVLSGPLFYGTRSNVIVAVNAFSNTVWRHFPTLI